MTTSGQFFFSMLTHALIDDLKQISFIFYESVALTAFNITLELHRFFQCWKKFFEQPEEVRVFSFQDILIKYCECCVVNDIPTYIQEPIVQIIMCVVQKEIIRL